jgi:hypothetical protein
MRTFLAANSLPLKARKTASLQDREEHIENLEDWSRIYRKIHI